MTLNYTWPLMLALLSSPLLGQRITVGQVAAMAVSFTGVVTIATGGDFTALRFSNLPGVSLALGSSVVWALFWIVNLRDPRDEVV
jgi:drug/metabolite transporter (DMT)-like permease